MAIKDVVVALAVRDEDDPARDYALSMASSLGSHVAAIAYAFTPEVGFSMYPEFVGNLAQQAQDEAKTAVTLACQRFAEAAQTAAVQHSIDHCSASVQLARSDLAARLRTADLGIFTQHKSGDPERLGDVFVETALFQSGRPIIVAPRAYRERFSLERVLIAWDSSIHAARAVAGAMPLLMPGANIEVFTVHESAKGQDFHGGALVQHLRRHGLDAHLAERHEADAAEAILREADSFRATLVVMGAYGHSRFREFVFGGATRLMFNQMRVPVLMSH